MNEKESKTARQNAEHEAKTTAVRKKKRITSTPVEEIKWDPDSVFKENKYYTRIAGKFKICKYITAVLALVFSVVMLTVFSSDLSSENFKYLIKDLDITGLISDGDFASVIYNGSADTEFGIYRGELAVISSGDTSLYSSNGALSLNSPNIFYKPKLVTSDKYFLVYDKGNTSFSVYNSFAELEKQKLKHPISGAALSDSGSYAIITRDDTYKGVLLLYNENFELLNEIRKDKYIISADITSNGTFLSMASVYDKDGGLVTELMTVKVGGNEAEASIEINDSMPMKIKFLDNGNISVLFTDRFSVYDSGLTEISTVKFESMISLMADVGDDIIAFSYNETLVGNDKAVLIYNGDGELITERNYSGELLKICSFDKTLFLMFEDRVVKYDTESEIELVSSIAPNAIDLVFNTSGLPIVCHSGNAEPIFFDNDETPNTSETAD